MFFESVLDLLIALLASVVLSWSAVAAGSKTGLLLKHLYLKDRLTRMCSDMALTLVSCDDPTRARVIRDRADAISLLIQSSQRVAVGAGYQAFQRGALAFLSGFFLWIVF